MAVSHSNAALIIVDLQEDFLPPNGSLAVTDGRSIIPKIAKLLELKWDLVVTTQDWHPKTHTSFASNHKDVKPFQELTFKHPLNEIDPKTGEIKIMKQVVWPDHCIQNSFGSEIAKEFKIPLHKLEENGNCKTVNVKKGYIEDREYYSCFQDSWGLHKTELNDYLKENKITDVFLVGIAYDFCVLHSAKDASALGYNTFVISDCSKSVYPNDITKTDEIYTSSNVKIIDSSSKELANLK
ncbi:hypothetical protein PACTADRAFT_84336 [Pachysolen tannophilus NRRL Y-2460]|uniref:nicotinamidase n=1 Tax=Pachysolen tannophilus NRRL Y-2460 TaxID=669874 RepID=A0A1E4TZC5_PACTA|nr:hypothetical protein PACTADRAFT_84336 [Pachysolen tannophilus NRRL Y-2460]